MKSAFGERLKRLRKNEGMTQAEVALRLDKSASAVRMWELGVNEPDMKTLIELSILFDCSLDYLLCRDLYLGADAAVRTGLPVYRLSDFNDRSEPLFYKSIPSDYLNNGGSFIMLLNDTDDALPLIPRDSFVLIRRQDACLEGQICFAKIADSYLLRRVNFYDGGAILSGTLCGVPPVTADTDSAHFSILGVATEFWKTI